MTLEVRIWVSSIRDGWQGDRARRPSQLRVMSDVQGGQESSQWLLIYLLAQRAVQGRMLKVKS